MLYTPWNCTTQNVVDKAALKNKTIFGVKVETQHGKRQPKSWGGWGFVERFCFLREPVMGSERLPHCNKERQ
ncbi:hypothetical protein K239x_19400 [Planctomycetes bacterium K23_9]|uniref:Uncharacterized protein n=1 Tax=Stieleria marina TaxID=1930275 RepID=A0A517NS79_9BACT|nr:hypothetical protein K239x_19400 [Planctomycetes bacterium K23_9]